MEAFLASLTLVAIGEIGDKTQLLSFALASRYRGRARNLFAILAGITLATLLNHGLSAWAGVWLANTVPMQRMQWILGGSFIALGLWMLIPDKDEELDERKKWGPFIASFVLFFIAEIGDKTHVATVARAARCPRDFVAVLSGTTLGMVAAHAPLIWLGAKLTNPKWESWAHRISALLFVVFGAITLIS
jgi:putative Ca2+/H+ antiporter (TMEM165/GDT1 family)